MTDQKDSIFSALKGVSLVRNIQEKTVHHCCQKFLFAKICALLFTDYTFEKWMVSEYPKVLPRGCIGGAIKYTYGIYHKLTRYHLDGRFKMDNNLAENAIRPVALGYAA